MAVVNKQGNLPKSPVVGTARQVTQQQPHARNLKAYIEAFMDFSPEYSPGGLSITSLSRDPTLELAPAVGMVRPLQGQGRVRSFRLWDPA